MRNEFFHAEDADKKRSKMCNLIRHRIKDIEKKHLELVLDALDYERQYYVKIMRNPQKFKNIIVKEIIQHSDENIQSESFPIYGEFTCGLYKKTETELRCEPSEMKEDTPAAAIKHTRIISGTSLRSLHEIVIYQPQ